MMIEDVLNVLAAPLLSGRGAGGKDDCLGYVQVHADWFWDRYRE